MLNPLLGLAILLPGLARAQDSPASAPYNISVNVDLVTLQATVRDRKGLLVSDLTEQDFQVYEDGVRQSLRLFRHEDAPVTIGLVIDHSGSMRPKMGDVIAGARTFVGSSNPHDQMFVVNFNEKVTLGFGETRFTNRATELESAVLSAPTTGRTALYDALVAALEQLQAGSEEKKALLVISDGGDNASTHTLAEVLKLAGQSNTLVYTVGIFDPDDPDRNPDVLRRLAEGTGGQSYFPSQTSEMVTICGQIAHDLRNQYTLGYITTNRSQSGYRTIRVTASRAAGGKLHVRARSGYIRGGAGK